MEIKSFLHFKDITKLNSNNEVTKWRPLFDITGKSVLYSSSSAEMSQWSKNTSADTALSSAF